MTAVRVAEAPGLCLQHPVHDPRVQDEERLDRGGGHREAAHGRDGDDVRGRRLAEQDRDLAEEVAAVELGALRPVDGDVRVALEDHVEAGRRQPLAEDALALREVHLLERARDPEELRRLQVPEQGEPRENVRDLLSRGHAIASCQLGCAA